MILKNTITHKIGFLYLAFAHQTDGIYLQSEQLVLWKKVEDWTEIQLTKGEFTHIMDEVMHDYRTEIAQDTVLTSVIEIANDLLSLPSFDYLHRTQVLRDLIDIASADNKMLDREIEWIQTLGAIWNVKPADINRICNIRNK